MQNVTSKLAIDTFRQMSDGELTVMALNSESKQNRQTAQMELWGRAHDSVRYVIDKYRLCDQLKKDLMQECFIGLMTNLNKFDSTRAGIGVFAGFQARKVCFDQYAKISGSIAQPVGKVDAARFVEIDEDAIVTEDETIDRVFMDLEKSIIQETEVVDALNRLTERDRNLVLDFYGVGINEPVALEVLAKQRGVTKRTLRTILREIVKTLNRMVSDEAKGLSITRKQVAA